MPLEGELLVQLIWNGQHVERVMVRSTRPSTLARVLVGMTPTSVLATVPLLFSICARAQGAAAASALNAARAMEVSDANERELDVLLETVQEYFWRLLIDWPEAMAQRPVTTPVATARRLIEASLSNADGARGQEGALAISELAAALSASATESIYGLPPAAWLALDERSFQAWIDEPPTLPARLLGELLSDMPRLGCSEVALMPEVAEDQLINVVAPAMVRDPAFARLPTWNGAPVETGVLARVRSEARVAAIMERCGNSVGTRMAARLVELALMLNELGHPKPGRLRIQAVRLAADEGLAAVQTARGLLLHRARVADGRVADYEIVAPTEWNFHPEGALAHGIAELTADSESALKQQARLAVQALDPCVVCRIEVGHA